MESTQVIRTYMRKILKLGRYRKWNLESITCYFHISSVDDCKPSCFDDAHGVKKWDDAMVEEM